MLIGFYSVLIFCYALLLPFEVFHDKVPARFFHFPSMSLDRSAFAWWYFHFHYCWPRLRAFPIHSPLLALAQSPLQLHNNRWFFHILSQYPMPNHTHRPPKYHLESNSQVFHPCFFALLLLWNGLFCMQSLTHLHTPTQQLFTQLFFALLKQTQTIIKKQQFVRMSFCC